MSIKVICTGDLMLGENVHHFRRGIVRKFDGNYRNLLSDQVKAKLNEADFVLMNFEAGIAPDDDLKKMDIDRAVYVAPFQSLDIFDGISSVIIGSVANNHFGQHGNNAAAKSIQLLKEKGILLTGVSHLPLILDKEGTKLCFFGVSLVKDKYFEGAYFKSTYEDLITDLKLREKAENEIWLISIHWGAEYYTIENTKQQQLAKKLADAGFDFIIGHHPHVVQPVRRSDKSVVFYSHGNFIFDQNFSSLTQKGLVSEINLPSGHTNLYLSHQKKYKVVSLEPINADELDSFCKRNFHQRKPLIMRIKMKLELLFRFYELNLPIIKTFSTRMFKN